MDPSAELAQFPPFKRLRYRLEYCALEFVAALIPLLPYEALAPIANALGSLGYHLDSRGRATALANLATIFPERSADERSRIAEMSYQSFARTMLCLFWSPNLSATKLHRFLEITGLDSDPVHRSPGEPAIYFCFHFSNFEWLSHASAWAIQTGPVIFQQFKNPLLGPVFSRLRATSGHEIIPQSRALIRMLKVLKAGGKFGVLTDLSLDPKHGAIPIRCFGLWTAASPLIAVLHARTNAKLIPCETLPNPDGTYRAVYHPPLQIPPDATPSEVAQACWDALEPSIRQHPECWLWAYKQWRFRPANADPTTYPTYANPTKRFDKLLGTVTTQKEKSA